MPNTRESLEKKLKIAGEELKRCKDNFYQAASVAAYYGDEDTDFHKAYNRVKKTLNQIKLTSS